MAEARIVRSSEGDVYERLWLFKHGSLKGGRFDFMVGNIVTSPARRFISIVSRTTRSSSLRACSRSRSAMRCSTSGRKTERDAIRFGCPFGHAAAWYGNQVAFRLRSMSDDANADADVRG
jgi:hypothetical protein